MSRVAGILMKLFFRKYSREFRILGLIVFLMIRVSPIITRSIDEEDLLRFMKKEDVDNVIPLFEGAAERKRIKRSALKNWLVSFISVSVRFGKYQKCSSTLHCRSNDELLIKTFCILQVKVYLERKSLAHSLSDAKTAIEELNKLASGILVIVIIIVWLLIMGFLTTKVLVFISSQLLLVVFIFGNTAKTVFEAIIFVFVMHPFDVGDRCVIDGVQVSLLVPASFNPKQVSS